MRKIYFRADAGESIGYGHFIRSLALAGMLCHDFKCTFFTQTPTEYQRTEAAKVCDLVELPSDDSKFGIFLDYLQGDEIVVLDNYFYDTGYQGKIKAKGCKLVCIDDVHDKHYLADLIINHAPSVVPADFSCEEYTRFCLGLDYVLIREEFIKRSPVETSYKLPLSAFICFGGSDYLNLTQRVAEFVIKLPMIKHVKCIVGEAFSHTEELMKFTNKNQNIIQVYHNLSSADMADIMLNSTFGIVPASTVLYETLCMKVPAISGYYVDNQIDIYNGFKEKHLIEGADDFSNLTGFRLVLENFVSNLSQYSHELNKLVMKDVPLRFKRVFKTLNE